MPPAAVWPREAEGCSRDTRSRAKARSGGRLTGGAGVELWVQLERGELPGNMECGERQGALGLLPSLVFLPLSLFSPPILPPPSSPAPAPTPTLTHRQVLLYGQATILLPQSSKYRTYRHVQFSQLTPRCDFKHYEMPMRELAWLLHVYRRGHRGPETCSNCPGPHS